MDGIDPIAFGLKAENGRQYSAEVLCASWIPEFSALSNRSETRREPVTEHGVAEAEAFLSRFYRTQGA